MTATIADSALQDETVYSVSEVAKLLRTTEASVRREIHSGRLSAFRWGTVDLRVLRKDLQAYIVAQRSTGPSPLRHGGRGGRQTGRPRKQGAASTRKK